MAISSTAQFYFAYGSNMNQLRMQGRDMRVVSLVAGWIDGFGLRFNKRSRRDDNLACANIVFARNERIEGVLYEQTNYKSSKYKLVINTASTSMPIDEILIVRLVIYTV